MLASISEFQSKALIQTIGASPDLLIALAHIVPTFVMQAFDNDLAGETLQAKLQGLSCSDVLARVNGMPRHTLADIEVCPGDNH